MVIVVISMLSSCAVVVPTFNEANIPEKCDLFTKNIELDIISTKINLVNCGNKMCGVLLFVSAGVFDTSAIISSSIYLMGNTVHYLEKEARCNDQTIIDEQIVEFSNKMEAIGAEKIDEDKIQVFEVDTSLNEEPKIKASEFKYIELDDPSIE